MIWKAGRQWEAFSIYFTNGFTPMKEPDFDP
jgi:hypothetical protein